MSPVPVLHVEKKPPNHDQGQLISCVSTLVALLFPIVSLRQRKRKFSEKIRRKEMLKEMLREKFATK
jgi:hypothetical protein